MRKTTYLVCVVVVRLVESLLFSLFSDFLVLPLDGVAFLGSFTGGECSSALT